MGEFIAGAGRRVTVFCEKVRFIPEFRALKPQPGRYGRFLNVPDSRRRHTEPYPDWLSNFRKVISRLQ
jgi:hypothetical protein